MSQRLNIEIQEDGNVVVEADGFVGKACVLEAMKLIDALSELGVDIQVSQFQPKPELSYFEGVAQQGQMGQRQ